MQLNFSQTEVSIKEKYKEQLNGEKNKMHARHKI
jgi:hypothetical protein